MTRSLAILMLATVFVLLFLVVLVQGVFTVTRLAAVEDMHGLVQVRDKGGDNWRRATAGMLIRAGTAIRVGEKGHVILKWADGSRLKLTSGAQVIYRRWHFNRLTRSSRASFYQLIGRVVFKVRKVLRGTTKFEVSTPTVVAAVRGTTFDVEVMADKTTIVSVLDGAVAVTGRGFRSIVAAGQEGVSRAGGFAVAQMSDERRSMWEQEVGFAGPFLKVEDPEDGLKTSEPFIVVSGLTDPGAQVTVNDARVPADDEGRFMARVSLEEGENKLRVAASEGNSQTAVTRSVFYANPAAVISVSWSPGEREDEAAISVNVMDANNKPVPDGTLVRFATTLGKISEEARTKGGRAGATLEVSPTEAGVAQVTATSGRAEGRVSIEVQAGAQAPAGPPEAQQPAAERPAEPAPAPAPAEPR